MYLGVLGFCSLPDFVKKRLKRGKIGFPVYLHCRGCFSLISRFSGGLAGLRVAGLELRWFVSSDQGQQGGERGGRLVRLVAKDCFAEAVQY